MSAIAANVRRILAGLPPGVELVAAAKGRSPDEVLEAIGAGVGIVGENYVQDAEKAYATIGQRVKWHFIGHLQRNKVKRAVKLCDMVQTVDSVAIAGEIDRRCAEIGKVMPVLIEVNSGRESRKSGIFPENTEQLVRGISHLLNIRIEGLMTIGPAVCDGEAYRPYFAATKRLFDEIGRLNLPNVEMRYLSMGMSDSYSVALGEGANMVRLGRGIFGQRS